MGKPGGKRHCLMEIALLLFLLLWSSQALAMVGSGEGVRRVSLRIMSRAIFEQLRQTHQHRKCSPSGCPPPSPPSLSNRGGDEDDMHPVYGVAKRLVPTGPNPLHN